MIMKQMKTMKTAYAAALILAAASGSAMAFAGQAYGQTSAASAKPAVTLSSKAMIERIETDASGAEIITLKNPSDEKEIIVPGDRIVFTLSYENKGSEPATSFRAVNPMPAAIQFVSVAEEWAEVSVDGGKTWGKLEQLQVASAPAETAEEEASASDTPAMRSADAKDVTHVRWVFDEPIPVGAAGSVSYRGTVK